MKLSILVLFLSTAERSIALSKAIVSNRCSFPVYLKSVQLNETPTYTLLPGDCYSETYRYASAFNPATGDTSAVGVSIKITTNETVGLSVDDFARTAAFNSSAITQFEYTYDPAPCPLRDLYYDLSDINDDIPRQFCDYGITIEPSSAECDTIACSSDCAHVCVDAYNNPADNATHACFSNINLNLILCTGG